MGRREQTRHVRLLFAPLDHIVIEYPLSSFVRPQGPSHRFVVVSYAAAAQESSSGQGGRRGLRGAPPPLPQASLSRGQGGWCDPLTDPPVFCPGRQNLPPRFLQPYLVIFIIVLSPVNQNNVLAEINFG